MAYQRFKYWQIRMAVLHIQASWRGHVARNQALEIRHAHLCIKHCKAIARMSGTEFLSDWHKLCIMLGKESRDPRPFTAPSRP